jgi:hypothetical protein
MTIAIEAQLSCIQEAFSENYPLDDSNPDWLRINVQKLRNGQTVTIADLEEIDKHNSQLDPTCYSDPTKITIASLNKHSNL